MTECFFGPPRTKHVTKKVCVNKIGCFANMVFAAKKKQHVHIKNKEKSTGAVVLVLVKCVLQKRVLH